MVEDRRFKSMLAKHLTELEPDKLPSSYQIVGDILLVKLYGRAREYKTKIGHVILELFPYIRTVCMITGIEGEYREPDVEVIAGENKTETIHKENKCLFKLDVAKVMFSKGNLFERQRLLKLVKPNETIVDMFAGIGYFVIPLAKRTQAKKIYAIEKNPVAFQYLNENIWLNGLTNIEPVFGDCRSKEISDKLRGSATRVLVGFFPGTEKFLSTAFNYLDTEGVVHYHNVYAQSELWDKPIKQVEEEAEKSGYRILDIQKKKVKSTAPNMFHVVLDVHVEKFRF